MRSKNKIFDLCRVRYPSGNSLCCTKSFQTVFTSNFSVSLSALWFSTIWTSSFYWSLPHSRLHSDTIECFHLMLWCCALFCSVGFQKKKNLRASQSKTYSMNLAPKYLSCVHLVFGHHFAPHFFVSFKSKMILAAICSENFWIQFSMRFERVSIVMGRDRIGQESVSQKQL